MNNTQTKILEELTKVDSITTNSLAQKLNLSRSITSHYLNQLAKDKIIKKIPNYPVLWSYKKSAIEDNQSPFANFIGSKGSLQKIVNQCKTAVSYPPKGINILITGNSGVGKSYLAQKIVEEARYEHVIAHNAPYVVLNCADYANNPELISSILFGYVKGAFTGATEDHLGLLQQVNGGYLFLDEVHQLASENQEKLFTFMDTGTFHRMGDSKTLCHANVRLVFATTEDPKQVMLTTFQRRIPIVVHLPNYIKRPIDERLGILESLFFQEAQQVQKTMVISGEVVKQLLMVDNPGNIGYLKNLIKVGCATAYREQKSQSILHVDQSSFYFEQISKTTSQLENLIIDPNEPKMLYAHDILTDQLEELQITFSTSDQDKLISKIHDCLTKLEGKIPSWVLQTSEHQQHRLIFQRIICHQFGLKAAVYIEPLMYVLYRQHFHFQIADYSQLFHYLQLQCPRSLHLARHFYQKLPILNKNSQISLIVILAIMLQDYVDETVQLRGLIVAHGDSTATSIQTVVNSLCGNYLFDALDMPIDTGVDSIIKETIKLLDDFDTTKGFILMIDMGSLSQLYTSIKSHLNGDLLVVNNLTTVTALDLALNMQQNRSFKELAEHAEKSYTIDVKYYEGVSQTANILISCISGLGLAEKIKEIMQKYLPPNIQVISLDYAQLKEKIASNDFKFFSKTLFVLTTIELNDAQLFSHLNVYDLLDNSGLLKFKKWLSPYLQLNNIEKLSDELVQFFSLKGVSERLSFLNPEVIIQEVGTVITKYENYYHLKLTGKVKLNLYMHISLMIERLMVRKTIDESIVVKEMEEQDFFKVSHSVFRPIELKYNIKISDYELSLMYELFKSIK
ncbi:PRD domain-containing protein [Bombilactobacillus bombi]|uniref:sigma 54-interacting transcriptional regulator n=1 Tax=Bombilactobacillus bombi TaxID=1303590 RepID=UPI000E56BBB7|nr:sigma 54-interacting transcriptional regulator [Bombilactobacillus bombi]AXX65098.1 PRD domain-containing protein [Bombilactobacillus bombi]